MFKFNRWIALFSQTGSEIINLSNHITRYPDLIITDNSNVESWHPKIQVIGKHNVVKLISKSNCKNVKVLSDLFELDKSNETCITLHGWLNILPAKICESFQIYNGHPGLITEYPELKGKDPQKRTWENIKIYPTVGSVVHKVVAEVDAGDIVSYDTVNSSCCTSLDTTYKVLTETSLNAWKKSINTILY